MATKPRDNQRQKIYDAEDHLRHGNRFANIDDCQHYVDHLLAMKRVQNRFPNIIDTTIHVRGGGQGGAIYFDSERRPNGTRGPIITMSRCDLSEKTLLHEFAHHITRHTRSHGWEYAEAMLWLVKNRMGATDEAKLRQAYRSTGARWTKPRPKREATPAQKAHLAKVREIREAKMAAERGEWIVRQESNAIYGIIDGVGRHRGIHVFTPAPEAATVWKLRSTAEKWARHKGMTWRVISLADALSERDGMLGVAKAQ